MPVSLNRLARSLGILCLQKQCFVLYRCQHIAGLRLWPLNIVSQICSRLMITHLHLALTCFWKTRLNKDCILPGVNGVKDSFVGCSHSWWSVNLRLAPFKKQCWSIFKDRKLNKFNLYNSIPNKKNTLAALNSQFSERKIKAWEVINLKKKRTTYRNSCYHSDLGKRNGAYSCNQQSKNWSGWPIKNGVWISLQSTQPREQWALRSEAWLQRTKCHFSPKINENELLAAWWLHFLKSMHAHMQKYVWLQVHTTHIPMALKHASQKANLCWLLECEVPVCSVCV